MNEKDKKEASGVRTMQPPALPPAGAPSRDEDGTGLFVEVDRHTATCRPSTEESSSIVTIQTLQRMKAEMMQQMENEIEGVIRRHQEMHQQEGMPMVVSSSTTEETFEEDGIEKVCILAGQIHSFAVLNRSY